jgi:Zn-dependent M28 family amino/carboxypeptidase
VAGVRRGVDPKLKDEYVVISAHLDHVGVGAPINGDGIYNGAMDNASGVAALMEIAAALHEAGTKTRRSLVFVAVTGEEKGLTGSRYFAAHPTVRGTLVANLNMDMFLPLFPLKMLLALGAEESDLGDRLREVLRPRGIELQQDPEPQRNRFIRSDQYSFIRKGIPSLAFKVGYAANSKEAEIARVWTKERYHAPSDDLSQPLDLQAAADFCRLLAALAVQVADHPEPPRWKADSFFRRFANP